MRKEIALGILAALTVSYAGIPPQEIVNGVLEVRLNVASYDQITRISNTSDVADRVLDKYIIMKMS